jgi:integrase
VELAIYARQKNEAGKWRYQRIDQGPGRKYGHLKHPFYFRPTLPNGKRSWIELKARSFAEAKTEIPGLEAALEAQKKGLTVAEADDITNAKRTPLKLAIEKFLDLKRDKAAKTLAQYTLVLNQFKEQAGIRFIDEVTSDVLDSYKRYLEKEDFAPKTIKNRLLIVCFLLKKNGIQNSTKLVEMPTIEDEVAEPYTRQQLDALFVYFDRQGLEEENQRYRFFLGSSLREREVMFTQWDDINFERGTVRVHAKKDMGFTVKNHEARVVPLPTDVVEMLKSRHKNRPHDRWLFVSSNGKPEGHFLRKLKTHALRAGLNCGRCKSTETKGGYDHKREVEVTCKTDDICGQWKLHRFRKTRATRWMEAGIPIRNIQRWLGHRSLETTMVYLGLTGVEDLREKIDAS